jgi:hypothetical protein
MSQGVYDVKYYIYTKNGITQLFLAIENPLKQVHPIAGGMLRR